MARKNEKKTDIVTDDVKLPKTGCVLFPANATIVLRRRIVSAVLGLLFVAAGVFFTAYDRRVILLIAAAIGLVACALIFAQSFLIARYRVAIDYEQKLVILRYQFQKIVLPFKDFETRLGEPDRIAQTLQRVGTKDKMPSYLLLDNVRDSVCYQTSSKDLLSDEALSDLRVRCEAIQAANRGLPQIEDDKGQKDELDDIVKRAQHDKDVDESI